MATVIGMALAVYALNLVWHSHDRLSALLRPVGLWTAVICLTVLQTVMNNSMLGEIFRLCVVVLGILFFDAIDSTEGGADSLIEAGVDNVAITAH